MKNLLHIAIIVWLLAPGLLRAQQYTPFPEGDVMWTEIYRRSEFDPFTLHYYRLQNGDTILNGKTYHKLYRSSDTFSTHAVYVGGLRDDTASRKVYLGDILLYDFSVELGDTLYADLYTHWRNDLLVHSIDSVMIGGSYHRRINLRMAFSPINDVLPSAWVEGVGNLVRGVVFTSGTLPNNGMWNELECMHQGGQPVYHNTTDWDIFDGDNSVSADCPVPYSQAIPEQQTAAPAVLYPNPLSGTGRLVLASPSGYTQLVVYDAAGRQIASHELRGKTEVALEQGNFVAGTYTYILTRNGGQAAHGIFTVR